MFERIGSLMGELMSVDVAALGRDELWDQLEAAARLEKIAGTLAARYAAEVKRRSAPEEPGGGFARREGHGNAGNLISSLTGGSVQRAKRSMEAGDAFTPVPVDVTSQPGGEPGPLPSGAVPPGSDRPPVMRPKYPCVARAQADGDLSVDVAGIIVEGLNLVAGRVDDSYLHDVERKLVDKAHGLSVHRMQRVVANVISKLDHERLVERERRHHDERYVWWKEKLGGVVVFHGQMDAVTAAPVIEVLEQLATRDIRNQSRPNDPSASGDGVTDTRSVGQMRADALHELARHALGCGKMHRSGIRTTMVVRVTQRDIERRTGVGTIDGIETPVSLESLGMCCGDAASIHQFVDAHGNVLHQSPEHRGFSRTQRIALLDRDGGCARCGAPASHCEAHHIRWWEHGGATTIDNGVMLCTRCHHDVHRYGWGIDVIAGQVYFTPPGSDEHQRFVGGRAAFEIDLDPPPTPDDDWRGDEALIAAWNASNPHRFDDPYPTPEQDAALNQLLHA
ncbi:HNH endonuclease signature motif containing protein [Demequina sp. NBRC 110057]|uniref:HNH endonuclease n=1 Tax=Demequina sp. NBRC 110057 TaxID=1570346 RepID=UPI0013563FA2|nr:HNH endonuclease signature motif containing protein [Demequina sp. NBRC 110057]